MKFESSKTAIGVGVPKVTRKKETAKRAASVTVKCGCCKEELVINDFGGGLEIGGVLCTAERWRKILLPLIGKNK